MNCIKEKIKITVENNWKDMTLYIPWDSSLEDYIDVFKLILKHATFWDDTINELFNEEI